MIPLQAFIREYSGHFSAEEVAARSSSFGMSPAATEREIAGLLGDRKIASDRDGKVGWIYDPELYRRYQALPELRVRRG